MREVVQYLHYIYTVYAEDIDAWQEPIVPPPLVGVMPQDGTVKTKYVDSTVFTVCV